MLDTYAITSNQSGPHPSTEFCAAKHANTIFYRPFAKAQFEAFKKAWIWSKQFENGIILDSGCGTGDSTFFLSETYPEHGIIGIDQSEARLKKAQKRLADNKQKNLFFIRAKLEDFWRLSHESGWRFFHHFIFYPNPWPKAEHRMRRWHGHPVFPILLSLSKHLEIRSNWNIYLEEFSLATRKIAQKNGSKRHITRSEGITAFERKYLKYNIDCHSLVYEDLNFNAKAAKRIDSSDLATANLLLI